MPIELLLARHGNTFAKGDKVVWVGARTDLALTAEGEAQALRLHAALAAQPPAYALTGPLQRTRRHAELALGGGAVIEIRDALREIDYGAWEALSTDEIHARGGGEALTRWDQHSVWPAAPGWTPSEAQMLSNAREILAEVAARAAPRALIVSSNGVLRFFARCAENAEGVPDLKVRTGHVCRMAHDAGRWRVEAWNLAPEAL